LGAFLDRQRHLVRPFIDLRLFGSRDFSASLAIYSLSFVAFGGVSFLMAQYLQLSIGLSPFVAGVWTVAQFGAFIVGSMLTPLLVRRVRPEITIPGGLVLAAGGVALLAQVQGAAGLPPLVLGSLVIARVRWPARTLA